MFHNLAMDIAFLLIKNKIVNIEKRDTYVYVLETVILNGSLLAFFLIISLLSKEMLNFWSYLIFFIPLRFFAGGYQTKKSESGFVLLSVTYIMSIIVKKYMPLLYQNFYWRIAGLLSIIVILSLTPLINEHNHRKKLSKNKCKVIVGLLLTADLVFFILCCKYKWTIGSNMLIFIILNAALLVIAKIDKYITEEE